MLRALGIYALVFVALMAPYWVFTWWRYLPSALAIMGLVALERGRRWPDWLGLRIPLLHAVAALAMLAATAAGTEALKVFLAGRQGVSFLPVGWDWGGFVVTVSQALNQEMVLRALVLNFLSLRLRSGAYASLLVAAIFALGHWVFYASVDHAILSATTVSTLFVFMLVGNLLFVAFGHIAFPLALHIGWNLAKFSAPYLPRGGRSFFEEYEAFNFLEGSSFTLVLALVLLGITWAVVRARAERRDAATEPL